MPGTGELDVVTGALGFTGRYIARRLLDAGRAVRTLTGHPGRPNPFGDEVSVAPLDFERPAALTESLRGARALYNTYWVRFPHGGATYEQAVANTRTLIRAAREAGVARFVHVSIVSAAEDSPFPYFRGKAVVEREIRDSGLSYAIVRPTVIFGAEGILINNIAWLLRRFPLFLVPGTGRYRLQPVSVEDVADLAVGAGQNEESVELDAAGPEIYAFEELVRLVAETVSSRARIVHAPPRVALALSAPVGKLMRDVLITQEELAGLMSEVLVSTRPPAGQRRLSEWLAANAQTLGAAYQSELERHYRP